ncbi:hypothetical protein PBRA_007990 [Plasmodiophora brassicae]|uniref:Uncharacterized protein n=1 Tax=Plasmodiophora brassicae TaxID=37360 RepID=A0A0G4IZ06_PLABS|nr:hypothetical protein PBRA_007990 [Plasmodiophora brassicae]
MRCSFAATLGATFVASSSFSCSRGPKLVAGSTMIFAAMYSSRLFPARAAAWDRFSMWMGRHCSIKSMTARISGSNLASSNWVSESCRYMAASLGFLWRADFASGPISAWPQTAKLHPVLICAFPRHHRARAITNGDAADPLDTTVERSIRHRHLAIVERRTEQGVVRPYHAGVVSAVLALKAYT